MQEKRWTIKNNPSKDKIKDLSSQLNISNVLSKILIQRGVDDFEKAKAFFRPSIDLLHNPFLMKGMETSINRIKTAIDNKENILVYGDYDVDGTTSVSLVYLFFKDFTENIHYYIPDRYSEGYGISYQGIDFADDNNFSLIITLDCGIKAIEKVDYANSKGIDVIICDHHTPGDTIPKAYSILNPKQEDCNYPYKELSGCGIGFKLIQAYTEKHHLNKNDLYKFLDLVAISIACDIVPITGENRVLAYFGLRLLNKNPRAGIRAILDEKTLSKGLTISDIVFKIGPRINAAGRITHAHNSVELLIAETKQKAKELSELINQYNTERRAYDTSITEEALSMIQNNEIETVKSTVLYKEDWHKGVIGIVASRLIETYYRPTIILTKSKDVAAGSARSVVGYNVYDAIEKCSDLLEQFGGHKYAAGLTLPIENIELFREKFEQVVSETINEDLLIPEIVIDSEIDFDEINEKFYKILKQLAPFGPSNMKPVFMSQNVIDAGYSKTVGEDYKHLKLNVKQTHQSKVVEGIGFNLGHHIDKIKQGNTFQIVYTIEENVWNGNVSLQLNIKDLKFT